MKSQGIWIWILSGNPGFINIILVILKKGHQPTAGGIRASQGTFSSFS